MESNQPPFQKTFAVHPCMVRGASLDSDTCKNHGKLQQELVGGVPTPLKNMSQLGWIFQYMEKMFQTTNQRKHCWANEVAA